MKKMFLGALLVLSNVAYAEISIRIFEPIRFKDINTRSLGEYVIGEGTLEISTDRLNDVVDENGNVLKDENGVLMLGDSGKKIEFKIPEYGGLLNNGKRYLKVEKYVMEDSDKNYVVDREKKHIKIYAYIPKKSLNDKNEDASVLEGEYVGRVPIIAVQKSRIQKNSTTTSTGGMTLATPIVKDEIVTSETK